MIFAKTQSEPHPQMPPLPPHQIRCRLNRVHSLLLSETARAWVETNRARNEHGSVSQDPL
ncbi:hypothetical protein RHGRI_026453 [Rhododendron griersonianum]|uniref:Uncharacterized protein n=1 Tax=Rhododendron griersonianum TaxID=479676 RepID=A0AAV6ITE5_9ERIC|nr:hypothetical protein RHGRI_026453 [Rhododendron griersonianum]